MSIRYDDKFVKVPQMELEYTPEMISDLVRCKNDILYFLNFVTIITTRGEREKIGPIMYDFQFEMLDLIQNNNYCILLQSRQSSKSTTCGIFALWYTIFNPDKMVGIASNKEKGAKDVLRRIKIMYEELPFWLKPGVVEYNKNSIEFENGSRIETSGTTEDTFRGASLDCLLWDEAAFLPENIATGFYNSIYPIVASRPNGKIIIISTPNGVYNLFHTLYSGAEKKLNEYVFLKIPWWRVPGRDEKWKAKQLRNMTAEQFSQEFDCCFNGSSSTVISSKALEIINSTIEDPIETDLNGRLRIFETPTQGSKYLIGVDPSKGTGEHDAAIQVYRIESIVPVKLINVATFQSNITDTYEFSSIVNRLSIYYNEAMIGIENNGVGFSVAQNLWWTFENQNLYTHGNKENEIGIHASSQSKIKAVITMKKLIEDNSIIIKDRRTLKQLSTFVEKKNGGFASDNGGDDLVSALYWLCFLITTEYFSDVDLFKNTESEDDAWGILSDIDDYHYVNSDWTF